MSAPSSRPIGRVTAFMEDVWKRRLPNGGWEIRYTRPGTPGTVKVYGPDGYLVATKEVTA